MRVSDRCARRRQDGVAGRRPACRCVRRPRRSSWVSTMEPSHDESRSSRQRRRRCGFMPRECGEQPASVARGPVGQFAAAQRGGAAWESRARGFLGVHVRQSDSHVAVREGLEFLVRALRPGRRRRACAGVRVRPESRQHRPGNPRPRTDISDRHRQPTSPSGARSATTHGQRNIFSTIGDGWCGAGLAKGATTKSSARFAAC